ncbi:MAG: M56 family metallopeptidase [Muribaculaceae bacterium]|nr:M56 family metallopeptidase [Muribaculaceae bacterium]
MIIPPAILYFLKANAIIATAVLLYTLFFRGRHSFGLRRVCLLGSVGLALLLPLLGCIPVASHPLSGGALMLPQLTVSPLADNGAASEHISLSRVLPAAYMAVTALLLLRMAVRIVSVYCLIRKAACGSSLRSGVRFHYVRELGTDTAFSWFGHVFLPSRDMPDYIVRHELQHVRGLHTADIIISELLVALFWINPAAWLLRRLMRDNLEYIADSRTVSPANRMAYQMSLLSHVGSRAAIPLSNSFNLTSIKNRIIMMNRRPSHRGRGLRSLLCMPVLAAVVALSAVTLVKAAPASSQTDASVAPAAASQPSRAAQEAGMLKGRPGDACYPGGYAEFMNFIVTSPELKYPQSAINDGVEGTVIVEFTVASDGSVRDAKVTKSVRDDVDAVALNTVRKSPKWIPAKPGGESRVVVPVRFHLPSVSSK